MANLTPKQQVFVREYLLDLNATAAARRAGYSERTADRIGPELLGKNWVAAAIAAAQAERAERTQVTADRVLTELARIGLSDVRALFDDDGRLLPVAKLPAHVAAAVSSVEVVSGSDGAVTKIKLWDKPRALEMIGKHLGMFRDRVEVTGKDGGAIQHAVTVDFDIAAAVRDALGALAADDTGTA